MKQDFVRFLDVMSQDTFDGRQTIELADLMFRLHAPLEGTNGPADVAPLGDLFDNLSDPQKAMLLRIVCGEGIRFVQGAIIERLAAASEGRLPVQFFYSMPVQCLVELYRKAVERAEAEDAPGGAAGTGGVANEAAAEVDILGR